MADLRSADHHWPDSGRIFIMNEDSVAKIPLHWELNRPSFYRELTERFNLNEIKLLCSELDIKYEELDGTTLSTKAVALFDYFERTERLDDLFKACQKVRPKTDWWKFLRQMSLSPVPIPADPNSPILPQKRNWWLVVGVMLATMALGIGLGRWLWGNDRNINTNTIKDAIIYDFEQQNELDNWFLELGGQTTQPVRSTRVAFSGRYALQISVNLQATNLRDPAVSLPQLITTVSDTQNKVIIVRLFTPQTAPPNVAAQLFLREDRITIWGPYSRLVPGQWTTLTWLTTDTPPSETTFTEVGVEVKMDSVKRAGDGTEYNNSVHLDRFEILPYSDHFPSIENILQPIRLYHFEDSMNVPTEIELLRDYYSDSHMSELRIDESESSFYGTRSLTFNANLSPYEPDRNYAGISISLDEQIPAEAVSAFIYIPIRNDSEDTKNNLEGAKNFYITFWAETEKGKGYFSSKIQVPVGEWVPVFWGTGFANGRCAEEDESGDCIEGAFLWDEWHSPEIKELDIRVWRDGESYDGPVYLDQITFYQRKTSTD